MGRSEFRHSATFRLAIKACVPEKHGMNIAELNHVAIHVEDVERTHDFYSRVLRLEPLPRPAFDFPGAWFRLGSQQELHIIGDRNAPVHSHNRGTHFALLVDDIEAWEKHLTEVGADFNPKKSRPDGAWQIFIIDPDGHYIELCSKTGMAEM